MWCRISITSFKLSVKSRVQLTQTSYSTALHGATEINITSTAHVKLMIYCAAIPRQNQTMFTFICSAFSFKNGGTLQTSGNLPALAGVNRAREPQAWALLPAWRSLAQPDGQREEPYSTTAFPMDSAIPPSPKAPARGVPTQRPFKLHKQRTAENPQCLF